MLGRHTGGGMPSKLLVERCLTLLPGCSASLISKLGGSVLPTEPSLVTAEIDTSSRNAITLRKLRSPFSEQRLRFDGELGPARQVVTLFRPTGGLEPHNFSGFPLCPFLGEGEADAAVPLPLRLLYCEGGGFGTSLLCFLRGDGEEDRPDPPKEDESSDVWSERGKGHDVLGEGTLGFASICTRTSGSRCSE